MAIRLNLGELGPEFTDHVFETVGLLLKVIMISDFRLDHEITLPDCFKDIAKPIERSSDAMREKYGVD